MSISNYVISWKFLKDQLKLVKDPVLKNVMLAEFRKKAVRDWGFDPETSNLNKQVVLDDWEKELVEDVNDFKTFGYDNRVEKRKKEKEEAKARMGDFIEKGGKLSDLPDYLQNEHTTNLYLEVMAEKIDDCVNFLFTK